MIHPEQRYEIARQRHQEFVAEALSNQRLVQSSEGQPDTQPSGLQRLAGGLRAAAARVLRAMRRPAGEPRTSTPPM
jgi:hypothetical protein